MRSLAVRLAASCLLAGASCTSPPASTLPSGPPSAPQASPRPTAGPTATSPPTVGVDLVQAGWTRAIEGAVGQLDVSVAVGVGDRIVFQIAGQAPRIPASNQKLLTSMVALDTLGPDHRFPTVAATAGPPNGGVIRGDLWLIGSGDPELDAATMARLAVAVRAARITRITGGVVGDTSAFSREWWAPGWVPGLSRSFVTRTTALAFDGNTGSGLPEEAAAAALTSALRSLGVEISAEPGAGEAPAGLGTVAVTRSRPLRALLGVQNHGSVNFYAETLAKALGERGESARSTASGADVVETWAAARGVTAQVMDGSGLSHTNEVSAHGLVVLLLLAQGEPWGDVLDDSLAPPGAGTLEGRLIGLDVRAKTGTLFEASVSSLSGYVTSANGARVAFSVLSQGLDKGTAADIEDAIVRVLAAARVG